MDSQSVKNTDSAENKGYDSGKKVSGIKRHIAVDTQGLPHAIHVTTANVTDRAGALAMFDRRRANLSQVQNVLVDGGYTGKPFATAVQSLLGASVEVVKRNELHTFVVLPKRWVVERSFGWLEKCRRLWKNCERKLNTRPRPVVDGGFESLIDEPSPRSGDSEGAYRNRLSRLAVRQPFVSFQQRKGPLYRAGQRLAPAGYLNQIGPLGWCQFDFVLYGRHIRVRPPWKIIPKPTQSHILYQHFMEPALVLQALGLFRYRPFYTNKGPK